MKTDEEIQQNNWDELCELWGAYPTKDNPRWNKIKSTFSISRIKEDDATKSFNERNAMIDKLDPKSNVDEKFDALL